MIHAMLVTIDNLWSVVGSTNFDHRSFALNDEVNLAILDRDLASVIDADLADDLQQSRRLTETMLASPASQLSTGIQYPARLGHEPKRSYNYGRSAFTSIGMNGNVLLRLHHAIAAPGPPAPNDVKWHSARTASF